MKSHRALSPLVLVVACAQPQRLAPPSPSPPAPLVANASPAVASAEDASAAASIDPPDAEVAQAEASAPPAPTSTSACNEQPPQPNLIRGNFIIKGDKDEQKRRAQLHVDAIRYRTEKYGYFAGFGRPDMNPHPPSYYVEDTTFFGKPVKMHRLVIPALKCVEEDLKTTCADHPYQPQALAGIRFHNTYHDGEITNHAYGIAIDIDPSINSCCGCVAPWNSSPLCKRAKKTGYERMAMPECWVHVFERYGFYWLGHDVLEDTMHFEFLGEPEKIKKSP